MFTTNKLLRPGCVAWYTITGSPKSNALRYVQIVGRSHTLKGTVKSRCRVCKTPGHDLGDQEFSEYVEKPPNIYVFTGKYNVRSNFHACDINIFGITHKSAEYAIQYVKAMRSGDVPRATTEQEAATAFDAKKMEIKWCRLLVTWTREKPLWRR